MVFRLTQEQEEFRTDLALFVDEKIAPRALVYDRTGEHLDATFGDLASRGLWGMSVPERYGGLGYDAVTCTVAVEEVSRGCAATGLPFAVHTGVVCTPVLAYGSEDQKEQYLPRLASGEWLGSFMLTEPDAGSDAANLATVAERVGDTYRINGKKRYITNGSHNNFAILFAKTDPDAGAGGISAFLIETDADGYHPVEEDDRMGLRGADTSTVAIEDLRVPASALLGEDGDGLKIALGSLDHGRIGIAAQGVGIARAALDASVERARSRVQFGKPIARQQAIQWMLADMATRTEAAHAMTMVAADMKDRGARFSYEASVAKLFSSETTRFVTERAVQLHGGAGYMKGNLVEKLYRDAKILEIYEGTNEVQRMVIARSLLR